MMSATERGEPSPSPAAECEEAVLLEWTVHLRQRSPQRAVVVYAAMALAAGMGFLLFGSLLFALIGALVIFLSTSEWLLPIRYRLTTHRACVAYGATRLEIAWPQVRRVLLGRTGLRLSPLSFESRLDAFRGVPLRFAPDGEPGCRDEALRVIRSRIPPGVME